MMPTPIKIKIARITKAIFPFDDFDFAFRPGVVDTVLFIVAVLFLVAVGVAVVVVVVVDVVLAFDFVVVAAAIDEAVVFVLIVGVVVVFVVVEAAVVACASADAAGASIFTRLQLTNPGADIVRYLLSVVKLSVLSISGFICILVLMTPLRLRSVVLSELMI